MAKRKTHPDNEPWERMPGESVKNYGYFCAYRDMRYLPVNSPDELPKAKSGIENERSLRRIARQLNRSVRTLSELSSRYNWVMRCDAYDLIKSGFANDLDNAQIYWILHNAGGMDDSDISKFLRRLKALGGTSVMDDGITKKTVEPVPVSIPWESREKLLDRLERDLYRDFMALDTRNIASGTVTATQIRAAYEPLNSKVDQYEYCVLEFLRGILSVAGIDDQPTFTRSNIINVQEGIQTAVSAAEYLDDEYMTRKILTLLGDGDQVEEILRRKTAEDSARVGVFQDDKKRT